MKRHRDKAKPARRAMKKRSHKVGLPAGSPVYVGEKTPGESHARITLIEYEADSCQRREVTSPDEILPLKPPPAVTWINVDAVSDVALLARFGELFNLHPLLLEDILNTDQRPKFEELDGKLYIILKMFDFDPETRNVLTEQVSLVIDSNMVLTFQEAVGDEFDLVRERLKTDGTRMRKGGPGYLAYALMDLTVDHYFTALEKIGECLEDIESSLEPQPSPIVLRRLHGLRRELIFMRKHIWPTREVLGGLQRLETGFFNEQTRTYLRDVYEHTIQVMDTLETYRDLLSGIQELYLSVLSNRMNEIIKVLTVISTIFIPLTFIVGVYGMNFDYFPELHYRWSYPILWMVMLLLALGMLVFFKRQRWL